jgi:hypothetical protein
MELPGTPWGTPKAEDADIEGAPKISEVQTALPATASPDVMLDGALNLESPIIQDLETAVDPLAPRPAAAAAGASPAGRQRVMPTSEDLGSGSALLDGIFLPHAAVARARKRWKQAKTKASAVGRIDFPRPPEARPEFYANSVSAVQRKLFRQLDVNDDGFLDLEKTQKLVDLLQCKLPIDELFDAMLREQERSNILAPPECVSFEAFNHIFNERLGMRRHQYRLHVQTIFEAEANGEKDDRGTVVLHKEGFRLLVARTRNKLMLVPPAFDLDTDWATMTMGFSSLTPGETQQLVTFTEFES